MKMLFKKALLITSLVLAHETHALPKLQLDIYGGTYVAGDEESMMSSETQFDLYALVKDSLSIANPFVLTTALVPQEEGVAGGDFGNISVTTTQDDVSMTFNLGNDDFTFGKPGGLSKHGIFETDFWELAFNFESINTSGGYNVEDDGGSGPIAGDDLYFQAFQIDLSGFTGAYDVHFDLYSPSLGKFAPYSHDAGVLSVLSVDAPRNLFFMGLLMTFAGCYAKRRREYDGKVGKVSDSSSEVRF
ncbi:MAG: hypothetical protein ACI8W1_001589 [Candidatus Azotimanducaceae bacterium]|jgi:hypothetical protein